VRQTKSGGGEKSGNGPAEKATPASCAGGKICRRRTKRARKQSLDAGTGGGSTAEAATGKARDKPADGESSSLATQRPKLDLGGALLAWEKTGSGRCR
jgi:hypothetical protein